MTKKNKTDDELYATSEWCLQVVRFLTNAVPPSQRHLMARFESAVVKARDERSIRGMRMLKKDFLEWTKALSNSEQERLNVVLLARFGKGLRGESEKHKKEMEGLIERGKIASNDEYRELMAYIDELPPTKSGEIKLEKINAMLVEYEGSGVKPDSD